MPGHPGLNPGIIMPPGTPVIGCICLSLKQEVQRSNSGTPLDLQMQAINASQVRRQLAVYLCRASDAQPGCILPRLRCFEFATLALLS